MPKSKRDRVVSLTQTRKKGKALKKKLVEDVQECVETYRYVYVFTTENFRNASMKDVRAHWQGSRFFEGKNKVMQVALGKTSDDEYRTNLHKLSARIRGNRGLFFTDSGPEEVRGWFGAFEVPNYARSGFVTPFDFEIPAGVLEGFQSTMEPVLRGLGLPTRLQEGKIELEADVHVCSAGETLSPEQCKILELFEQQYAVFRINMECVWSEGEFTVFDEMEEEDDDGDDE